MENFFTLKSLSPIYAYYAYIDVPQHYADSLFIQHRVKVHFDKELNHPEHPYVVVFCKVRKRDRERFLAALSELNRKMILCGHPDYEAFCESFIAKTCAAADAVRK